MRVRRAVIALLILLIVLGVGAALRLPAARAATTRDQLMKTSLIALQCAIEEDGSARMWVYPHPREVSPAGGLEADFWPRDPWTGRRLAPGRERGHYIYTRAADTRSYTLVGYLAGGRTFAVKGGMTHLPMPAYDHCGKERLRLIFQYVKLWSLTHDGALPTATQVSRDGAVGRRRGKLFWPSNSWDHRAMEQGDDRGSFSYARSADGASFILALRQVLGGDWTLRGGPTKATEEDTP